MQPTALIRPLLELLLRYFNHSNHYEWIKLIYILNQRLLKLLLPLKPHRQQATRVEVVVTVGADTVEGALAAVANTDQDVLIFNWRVVGLYALLHFHYWLMEVFYFSIKKKIKNSNNKDIHLPLCYMNISHGCSISVSHMKSFSKLWSSVIQYNRFNTSTCVYWITVFLWTRSFSKQIYIASTSKFILKYDIKARFQYWHEIDEIIKIVILILVWNIKKS